MTSLEEGQNTPLCFKFVKYCRNVNACTRHASNSILSVALLIYFTGSDASQANLLKGPALVLNVSWTCNFYH